MVDTILLIFIGLFILFGFFRGVVSQLAAIAGFIAAYYFSKPASVFLDEPVSKNLGSTQVYGKPFSILIAGFLIYLACRVLGFIFEKVFINRDESLKSINRVGGAFFGGIKGCCILLIVFFLLKLVPEDVLKARAPKLAQSEIYQFIQEHPFLDEKYLETLREPLPQPIATPPKEEVKPSVILNEKAGKVVKKAESKISNESLTKELEKHTETKKPMKKK
jgi:uncharacterized membrane protein required for colicin V production